MLNNKRNMLLNNEIALKTFKTVAYIKKYKYCYFLLLPGILYFIVFNYIPMYGVIIAFKDFSFSKGIFASPWNDFKNFRLLFESQDFYRILLNSITLSLLRITINFPIPIVLAILLNEINIKSYKRLAQTIMYLPHFISWVVIGGIVTNFLSTETGVVNMIIASLGFETIPFLASEKWFRMIIVITNIWKEAGWGTIIYLAAITGINPEFYEAATVDGASRYHKIWHITIPGIRNIMVMLLLLSIGRILNNGFEQIFLFQNDLNLSVSEVFETYTYRLGLIKGEMSFATAVGLFQSVVGLVLMALANKAAKALGQNALYSTGG